MNGFNLRSPSAARLAGIRQRPLNNKLGLIGHSMLDQAIGQNATGQQIRIASLSLTAFPAWCRSCRAGATSSRRTASSPSPARWFPTFPKRL